MFLLKYKKSISKAVFFPNLKMKMIINYEYNMFEFFIEPAHQVQGIVVYALELVENYFEDAKVFRLITPPQVVRNCVFYVNKCGYQIVKVLDFNKGENYEDYLLKKEIN